MSNYLLRTEKDGLAPSLLLHFTEDDDYYPGLNAEEALTNYLRHLILLNHYSGLGPLMKAFWRWNDDDTIEELELKFLEELPEGDNDLDQHFRILVKETGKEITGFTVRI